MEWTVDVAAIHFVARIPRREPFRYPLCVHRFRFGNDATDIYEVLEHKAGYHGVPHDVVEERAVEALKTVGIWAKRDTRFDWPLIPSVVPRYRCSIPRSCRQTAREYNRRYQVG